MSNHPQYAPGTPLTVGTHTALVHKYLSSGGFAQVYKVEISPPWTPPNSNEPTSIACLKRVIVPNKQHLNTLRAEVDSMKRLAGKSKHIVSYIDSHAARMPSSSGEAGYEVFVLMELCENKGLIDFMNTRLTNRLTEQEILRIMGEVTEGICVMHNLQPALIHRDIKIENVLLASDGSYKVCDFGSAAPVLRPARNEDEMNVLRHDLMSNTTPQYRAPEMLDLTQGYPINEKADIWALGVFLYKLCYYTTPFEEGGDAQILSGRFRYLDMPRYSDRMKNLIGVLLRMDPRRRPNTYQVLEEVCKMRNVQVPFEDPYKRKKLQQQQQQQQQQPHVQPVAAQVMPNSNSTANLNSINLPLPPSSRLQPPLPPPHSNSSVSSPSSPPLKASSRPASMYNTSLSKSFGNLNINNNSSQLPAFQQQQQQQKAPQLPPPRPGRPVFRPKYVDSMTQTDDSGEYQDHEEDFKLPNRPPVKSRPLSMYSTKPVSAKSTESLQSASTITKVPTSKSDIQRQITASLNTPQFHEFRESQTGGEPTSRQSTGGSFKSLRRISSGAGKMIDQLTGKLSLSRGAAAAGVSRSSSRNSSVGSVNEFNAMTGNNPATLGNQMRKSSDSNYDNVVLPTAAANEHESPTLKRSNSIQRRISAFLSKANRDDGGIPTVKTATGYGNDNDNKDQDGFRKPPLPATSSRSLSGSSVKSSKSNSSTSSTTAKVKPPPPSKPTKPTHLKSKAPPKPIKPSFLKSNPASTTKRPTPPIPDRPKGNFPNLKSINHKSSQSSEVDSSTDEDEQGRNNDNEGIFNDKRVEEYERSFRDKFPPASSVF
ncbi:hypothetical protein WICPIJ_001523 [Wickerhamomyces pijperi]|uniref:non-specific serine/threonine protein kinase n=1 Tax=Wickerhamomyces pijperi TaxID=599730 RepID=A0A9P8QDC8_WICPI|nr:hypothetical protein WICPIJ_001523 [Wickerhamomyces pijperi]